MEFLDLVDVLRHRIALASSDHELRRIERAVTGVYGELAADLALAVAVDIAKRRRVLQREHEAEKAPKGHTASI